MSRYAFLTVLLIGILVVGYYTYSKVMTQRLFVEAASEGNINHLEKYLKLGADINGLALDGWTALTIAAREGKTNAVKWLLNNEADINLSEGGGNNPLFWVKESGNKELIAIIKTRKN